MQQTRKRKNVSFAIICFRSLTVYMTPFLNKTSLLKSLLLLRSGFHSVIYDVSKLFLASALFGAFEIIVHVKQWPVFSGRCKMVLNF